MQADNSCVTSKWSLQKSFLYRTKYIMQNFYLLPLLHIIMSLSLVFPHVLRSGATHLGVDRFEIRNKLQIPARRKREKMAHSEPLKHRIVMPSFARSHAAPEINLKSGANYNHFRMWQDLSISQDSYKNKIVLENSFMPGSKLLWDAFFCLPNTEQFLHLVTTLGSSSLGTCLALGTNASSPSEQDVRDHTQKKLWAMLKWIVLREKIRKHNENCTR